MANSELRIGIRVGGQDLWFSGEDTDVTVGRSPDASVVVPDGAVSRRHLQITPTSQGDGWLVRDLGSLNGTFVAGKRIHECLVTVPIRLRLGHPVRGAELQLIPTSDTETNVVDQSDKEEFSPSEMLERLSAQERRVLGYVAGGCTDKQIGAALFIAESTVRSHLDKIDAKVGLRRKADLMRFAHQVGITPVPCEAG